MSAFGGSQERRPHRIGGGGGTGPDCGSGLDSATSGELAAAARGGWRTSCAPLAERIPPSKLCGDGAAGAPDYAPYDRIIVTTGAWDLPPGDHLVSGSACRC